MLNTNAISRVNKHTYQSHFVFDSFLLFVNESDREWVCMGSCWCVIPWPLLMFSFTSELWLPEWPCAVVCRSIHSYIYSGSLWIRHCESMSKRFLLKNVLGWKIVLPITITAELQGTERKGWVWWASLHLCYCCVVNGPSNDTDECEEESRRWRKMPVVAGDKHKKESHLRNEEVKSHTQTGVKSIHLCHIHN